MYLGRLATAAAAAFELLSSDISNGLSTCAHGTGGQAGRGLGKQAERLIASANGELESALDEGEAMGESVGWCEWPHGNAVEAVGALLFKP